MTAAEIFVLIVRWVHGIAAVTWIGGSIFFLLILLPPIDRKILIPEQVRTVINIRFRGLVQVCISILIITGVILAFERLSSRFTDVAYVSILASKSMVTVWMFALAGFVPMRRRAPTVRRKLIASFTLIRWWDKLFGRVNEPNLILFLGLVAFILSNALQTLFERRLTGW